MRFAIFFLILTLILGLVAWYVGQRFIAQFGWAGNHRAIIWLTLGFLVVLQVLGPFLYRIYPNQFQRLFVFHWMTYMTLGVFACMFFYTAAADLLTLVWKVIFGFDNAVNFERRSFLTAGFMTFGSAMIGATQTAVGPGVYEVDIPLKDLPQEFDGFRIVQITDLHVGPTIGREYTGKVVEMANGLDPDLVALTGDFVDGSVAQIGSALAPIAQLKSRHGVFFVTGNHEYYWGVEEWLDEYRRLGARVLLNEHVLIKKDGQELVLAGVTDYSAAHIIPAHASNPRKSIEGASEKAIKVLLAHQPASYKQAAQAGFHLQLSGHTHGGQFFPWSIVVSLAQRYYKGLNKHEGLWIYVSRGAGYWGPPIRFLVPSEITRLTLRRA